MNNLVVIMKNEIFTTSKAIAEGVGVQHKSLVELLKDYSYIPELQRFQTAKVKTKGRSLEVIYLTELQATILITLMKNSPKVIEFKVKLSTEFFKQRKVISQLLLLKQNTDWLEARNKSKEMRKECINVIQKFVEYAKSQGSQSAEKYYMNFSRMELSGLFILEQKFPNARDVMSMRQLNLIEIADEAIANTLEECMNQNLPYKECYLKAKEKIELLAKIIPKSPLPALLHKEL